MNEILEIANKIRSENINICTRCLGRLFGKLGYGLDNTARGKTLCLMLSLQEGLTFSQDQDDRSTAINGIDTQQLNNLQDVLNSFALDGPMMAAAVKILGLDYRIDSKSSVRAKGSEQLEEQIRALIKPELIKHISLDTVDVALDLDEDTDHARSQSTEECSVCSGLFDELPNFVDLVCEAVKDYEFSDLLIGCKLDLDKTVYEDELWSSLGVSHPEPLKSEFNRELGKLVGSRLGKDVNFDTPDMTIVIDTRYDTVKLQVASLFIYGRYRKFVRDIPQTRWPCKQCWGKGCKKCDGTGKMYQTSVEEQIAQKVMEASGGKEHFFHGMGREDIGVLMLGNGRPFILEISVPVIRNLDLAKLQSEINTHASEKVEVLDLEFSNHRAVPVLKADKPSKTYLVNVKFEKKVDIGKLKEVISSLSGKIINQKTPTRVAHRRADLVRKRAVVDIELISSSSNGKSAEIEITSESGMYIKELINGDNGRTIPSLTSELDMVCTVQELDVLRINDKK